NEGNDERRTASDERTGDTWTRSQAAPAKPPQPPIAPMNRNAGTEMFHVTRSRADVEKTKVKTCQDPLALCFPTTMYSENEILVVPGYSFGRSISKTTDYGDRIGVAYGYRTADRLPVLAKVTYQQSLILERQFHITKRLCEQPEGSSFVVQPIERLSLSDGLTVVLFLDEGASHLDSFELSTSPRDSSPQPQPSIDVPTFLKFATKCCDCLDFVHRNQIIHGELRPSVFLWKYPDDIVKMKHFGTGARTFEATLTSEGWRKSTSSRESLAVLHNTLVYISPEQTGRTSYTPDHRTDLYSLGIMLFVLLSGQLPFEGGPIDILHSVLSKPVPKLHEIRPEIPRIISEIIEKLTNKSPNDRYSSAHGLREDLKECIRRLADSESISQFPLAEHDIASVFTLPSTVYGRSREIELISSIIRRVANATKTHVIHFADDGILSGSPSISDDISDASGETGSVTGDRSLVTPLSVTSATGSNTVGGDLPGASAMGSLRRRIKHTQTTEIIAIHGPAGVGKSTLANRAVQSQARDNGYVATAKFDNRQQTPYGCILQCISLIFKQLLTESEEEIAHFHKVLRNSLGAQLVNIRLIMDLVPELRPILGDMGIELMPEVEQLSSVESRARFHGIFIEIIRIISNWKMLTLFLDDIHQADEPSLDLVITLISAKIPLLIILSYRDNELPLKIPAILNSDHASVTNIPLQNLDSNALHELVGAALQRKKEEDLTDITPLVELLANRTKGNAFYTRQILFALERKGWIFFDWRASRWEYNLEGTAGMLASGSAEGDDIMDVEFLVQRLKELPLDSQKFLKWASFIGNVFSWESVKYLMTYADSSDSSDTDGEDTQKTPSTSPKSFGSLKNHRIKGVADATPTHGRKRKRLRGKDAVNGLEAAVREGIVLPVDGDTFKFMHDRFSQAAMLLADSTVTERIHFSIAEMLINTTTADVFLTADHLMKASELISTFVKKSPYRDVLVQAGDKASIAGAHAMALNYYKYAMKLTNEASWLDSPDSSYEKTLHLFVRAAELNWVVGNPATSEALLEEIFKHSRTPLDRAPAYQIQHRLFFQEKKHKNGGDALFTCLRELGLTGVKTDITREQLDEIFEQTKQEILQVGFSQIAQIGPCQDKTVQTIMDVLQEACTAAYWLSQLSLLFFIAAKLVSASLKNGMTKVSGIGFVFFGIAAVEGYQQYEIGQEIGELGVKIGEKYGRCYDCGRGKFLYTCFLDQWKHHLRETIPMYNECHELSLSAGDRIYASFSKVHIVTSSFHIGEYLSQVMQEAQLCFNEVHNWSPSADTNILVVSLMRTILALQGNTYLSEQGIFDDENFSDVAFVQENCDASSNPTVPMNWYLSYKMLPLVLYGFNEAAINLGFECISTMHCHPLHTRMMLYLHSLAMISILRDASIDGDTRRNYLDRVRENQRLIFEWVPHSGNNLAMWHTLVEAELASLSPATRKTDQLYEEAINQAHAGRWRLDSGIILEYAGEHYLRNGLKNIAVSLFDRSVSAYTAIGAYGKVRHLRSKHGELLSVLEDQAPTTNFGSQTDTYPVLDQKYSWDEVRNSSGPTSVKAATPASTEQALMELDIIDLASILKSSQVISSEVGFDSLLKSMMAIILENCGAEAGAIVVKGDDGAYSIVGYGSQKNGSTTFNPPKQLSDEDDLLSARIVLYAIHTRENVFITNVRADPRFSTGSWFARAGSISVICVPILHKSTLVGCLYLEGSVGSFTPKHLRVMTLLCQQIGISVTNALLFTENSEMIESQKKALREAKESRESALKAMRLKSTFLANMYYRRANAFFPLKDDLLNFSKLEAGKVALDLGDVYMEDLFADVIELLTILATRKGLNMSYIVDEAVPSILVGDSNRLKQILNNLIGNAIKFTHQGEIIVRCSLDKSTNISPDANDVMLHFEQLVHLMNGNAGVISEQGRGSTFWFTAKLSKALLGPNETPHQDLQREVLSLVQRLGKPRVLIGANFSSTVDMLGRFLDFSHQEKVLSFRETMESLQKSKFDVAVLDFPMDENGTELHAVQHNPRLHNLRIILFHTHSLEEIRLNEESTGAPGRKGPLVNAGAKVTRISKPARRLKLLRSMAEILNRPMSSKLRASVSLNRSARDILTKEEQESLVSRDIGTDVDLHLYRVDNAIAQKVLFKQLSNLGFSVDCANNGLEALEIWSAKPPGYYCMAFFDHHMPKCDGVEATKRLRRLELEIKTAHLLSIVALSADVQTSARTLCLEAGMNGYLTKPMKTDQLVGVLRKFCSSEIVEYPKFVDG
ncbi:hypothetical protein BC936DRAFT_145161, partial [Jimgerdemannia flammicorona]